ncbi:sensor histidine kinase [Dyadobacter aurulentus]|uniref:sensor histidine kinase n=1 Tax=Dyadobacter sp. UC 10 TaxID=2605428 RepID=UPI0011F13A8B|nr:ATP-binding protein [Dyadobacter sp. UC 10]KAA0992062.1 hypothetical protein FXO21_18725 [Dyadobacter sp. UC 10]
MKGGYRCRLFQNIRSFRYRLTRGQGLFYLLLVISYSEVCVGQRALVTDRDWTNILSKYASKSISDTIYLKEVEALAEGSFKDPQLKTKLATYQKIAWSNKDYQTYREKYYYLLATNSFFIHQEGFSIYYLQKQEEEFKKTRPYINSLSEPRMLLAIYGSDNQSNIARRLDIFRSNLPFLQSLPDLLSKQVVPYSTCINAMAILNHAAQIYANTNNSVKVVETFNLAKAIYDEMEKGARYTKVRMQQYRLRLYMTEHAKAKVLQDTKQESNLLHAAETLVRSLQIESPSAWLTAFERGLLMKIIDFHIKQNQIDSSKYYFKVLKNQVDFYGKNEPGDGTKFLIYSSKISAKVGNYRTAYDTLLRAYRTNDSIISIKTADIHNNMYAHMVAEQRSEELIRSEIEKGNRNLVIFIVSTILIGAVASFIVQQKVRDAEMVKQIDDLNNATQIQIAELEAKANMIQKKLGMELHDEISGNLVHICNYLATELLSEKNPDKRDRLQKLSALAKKTYIDTRHKSHEWYTQGTKEELEAFSVSILKIVSHALEDNKYEKHIEIDNDSLEKLSSLNRMHLLRIIQEAVSNIIKHAKASKINLYIYEEERSLTLQITDNGRGFDKNSKANSKGVGLQSIRNRIKEMNGSLDILTSHKGTELLCIIPI